MARLFTTKFSFNRKEYDAIVTIISQEGKPSFNIKVMDIALHDILPEGKINYQGKDGFREIHMDDHSARSLIHSIAHSIEQHLQDQPLAV
jgi:hypothetical protein